MCLLQKGLEDRRVARSEGAVVSVLRPSSVTFFSGDQMRCPARISRGNGSELCGRPIEIDLPPQTRAKVRVVVIPQYHPGEARVAAFRARVPR